MASIKLTGFVKLSPQITVNDPSPRILPEDEFVYKDIKLDLQFEGDLTNSPDGTTINTNDLVDLRDDNDIRQAVKNLFSTMPGQKVLNPYFGLNLSHYCFDPINPITANHLARTILIEAPAQDSRINIKHLFVNGNTDSNTYEIEFTLFIDNVNSGLLNIKGILNSDGFTLN